MGIQNVKVQKTIVCDRCGRKFIESPKNIPALAEAQASLEAVTVPVISVTSNFGKDVQYFDLCPRCKVVVTKLVAGLGPVAALPANPVR